MQDLAKHDIAISNGTVVTKSILARLQKPAKFNNPSESAYGHGWYFQCYPGEKLMWHSGWDPDSAYSGLLLRLPNPELAVAILANSAAVWWDNPLDKAEVQSSQFTSLFLDEFVFTAKRKLIDSDCTSDAKTG